MKEILAYITESRSLTYSRISNQWRDDGDVTIYSEGIPRIMHDWTWNDLKKKKWFRWFTFYPANIPNTITVVVRKSESGDLRCWQPVEVTSVFCRIRNEYNSRTKRNLKAPNVHTRQNIVQIDGHIGVAIRPHVFVPKSSGVHQLVHDDSGRPACDTSVIETHFLSAQVRQADVAPAAFPPQFDKQQVSYLWSIERNVQLLFK